MKKAAILLFLAWGVVSGSYAQNKKTYVLDSQFKSPDFVGDQVAAGAGQSPLVLPDGKVILITQKFDYIDDKHLSGNTLRINKDGSYDQTFQQTYIHPIYEISASKVFPDGKTVIIPDAKYSSIQQIINFNDRGVDTIYRPKGNYFVYGLKIQSDGKIVVLNLATESQKYELLRLLSDGSPDTTFRFAQEKFDDNSRFLGLTADDKVLIGGARFDTITVKLFKKDGQLENKFHLRQNNTAFSSTSLDIAQFSIFPNGKLFLKDLNSNTYFIFSADGNLEKKYSLPLSIKVDSRQSSLLSDGTIVESTQKMPYRINTVTNEITPLLKDTTLINPNFGYQITSLANGTFLLSNHINDLMWIDGAGNVLQKSSVRLHRSGVKSIQALLKDNQILADIQQNSSSDLYRLHKDGSFDNTFIFQPKKITQPTSFTSNRSFLANNIMNLYNLNDGSLLINLSPEWDSLPKTYRIKVDGSIDERFLRTGATTLPLPNNLFLIIPWSRYGIPPKREIVDNQGQAVNPQNAFHQLALQTDFSSYYLLEDGKLLIRAYDLKVNNFAFSRLLANGTPDPSFNLANQTLDIRAIQKDGKLLMGSDYQEELKRFNTDGSYDNTFKAVLSDNGPAPYVYKAYLQTNQKIIIFGRFGDYNKFMRLNTDGSADSTFIIPKELNLDLISSIYPVSEEEILIIYKGKIERLVVKECTVPQIKATKTLACANEPVQLSVGAISGFSYQWQKDGKALGLSDTVISVSAGAGGSYNVVAIDADCGRHSSNELTITFLPVPNAQIVKITPVVSPNPGGGTVSVLLEANGNPSWTYQWQKDSININGATNLQYEVKAPGYYRVKASHNECNHFSAALYIHISPGLLGTESPQQQNSVSVFPNPNNGTFKLDFSPGLSEGKVELFDMLGRTQPFRQQNGYFHTQLNKGTYLIRVSQGLKTATTKVVIE